ncbi:MAG: gliding motility-associated C-terminal domain-containing protein [Bacteroidales bacterium]|nr:gliding motility-associated C-terminal domain-containing protein [Bacteroidales bacterium]
MDRLIRIISLFFLIFLPAAELAAQPAWVQGTPVVDSTGPASITINYGLNVTGTVYIIVYNYENNSYPTSSYVRFMALMGGGGGIVETVILSVKKGDENKILQTVLQLNDPDQVHTIYIVAADSKRKLQATPVRLIARTLPCRPADAGSGGDECDRDFILSAVPVLGTGVWSRVSGPGNASFSPNAGTPDATVSVTAYGTYVFRWTENSGGCRSSDEVTVNFYQPPVANAGSGGSECDRDFNLQAVSPSSETAGTWTMTSGTGTATFMPSANSPAATVTVSEYGTKVFTWTVTNGTCTASSDVTVSFSSPPVANAGTGGNNCGLEFYLNAVPSSGTGTWTRVSGPGTARFYPNNHDPMARVTVSAYGTYVFRWTEVNGTCTSSSDITVGFFEQVSANAGSGGDECDLNFTLSAVQGTGTGTWSKVSGPGNVTFTPDAHRNNATVTVTQSGEYDFAWTVVSNNCTSTDVVRVVFHSAPVVNAGEDVAICRGGSIRLGATGTGSFSWIPANLLSNPAIANPLATPASTTVFTVTLTDQWGCRNSDRVTVEVRDRPTAYAGQDQILDFLFETDLEADPPGSNETGEWSVVSGSASFTDIFSNETHVWDLSIGDNAFVWRVSNSTCEPASDTVVIRVNELVLPSLITPDMDGNNDFFVIKGIESLGRVSMKVFNRWGACVFTSNDYANDWDGKDDNGNPLQEDTYYYVFKTDKIDAIKGFIVIKY